MTVCVNVTYSCNGCPAFATAPEQIINREFRSLSGRGHGIGAYVMTPVQIVSAAPEGWVAFDPYTMCTYCPACWKAIGEATETMADENVVREALESADRAYAKLHPDPYRNWVNGEQPAPGTDGA